MKQGVHSRVPFLVSSSLKNETRPWRIVPCLMSSSLKNKTRSHEDSYFIVFVGRLNFWIKPLNINYQSRSRKPELYCVLAQLTDQSINMFLCNDKLDTGMKHTFARK